jgi:HK97 family phage portal protein
MAWLFGKKSVERREVPAWLGGGEREGFARSYDAMVEEVFTSNPVGQRAVRLVAGAVGGLTLYGGDEASVAAADLVVRSGVMEPMAAAVLLHGNGYARLAANDRDEPAGLFLLRPERVEVVADGDGWARAYDYRVGLRAERIARTDEAGRRQVAHVRALNPVADQYGLGCLEAATPAATVHNRASRWNKALLDNAARPSGALTYAPGDGSSLSGEQFDRLQQELATQFSGSGNAGRPLLLEGGLSWQAMSMTPADMDFVALKEGAARDIALAFGVPPVLVGLPGDATYANAREAGRALYRQTVLPLAGSIVRELGAMLSDWLGPVRIDIDSDAISELAEDRARLWEQATSADFISRDEKRELLGYQREGAGQ